MKILMITPEVAPYVKVGGLADVVGALPKALDKLGDDVRIVCPRYGSLPIGEDWVAHDKPLGAHHGGHDHWCRVWETSMPGTSVRCYFLEHDGFYGRPEVYAGPWGSHKDNGERFTFLTRAALNFCYDLNWMPDVVHCHDWATGLAPVYLNTIDADAPLGQAASVMTIHNLQHQGYAHRGLVDFAGLPQHVFRSDNLEAMGAVNPMKGGIYNATKLTTVSPTYAREIQTPEFGCGLNHVLRFRAADLIGILNGIDVDEWNPENDPHIAAPFSADDISGKAACKADLQAAFNLEADPGVPVFGVVSRLYSQKGLDLLAAIIPRIMAEMEVQIIILGTGDSGLEHQFGYYAGRYSGKVGAYMGFSNKLAHKIIAGSDAFLMPSRFEPCGLSQMYSMRYGTPPVVRYTGGLADTVQQYEEGKGAGTGFVFEHPTPDGLYYTVGWACATYYDRPREFRQLAVNGMRKDFSWERSAAAYRNVYRWAIDMRNPAEPGDQPKAPGELDKAQTPYDKPETQAPFGMH